MSALAPAPSAIAGPIHAVTYVEAMPAAGMDAVAVLARYREGVRKEDGNLRCEVLGRIGQPHQLVVLEVWRDQPAFDAHRGSAHARQMREAIHAIRIAPLDERIHAGVSIGPLHGEVPSPGVYVVTHVDVIPPRKDDGLAALERLARESRGAPGNLRFEVVQQASRPNHFTVIETWEDASAVATHAMAAGTREFRDALGPMSGALYDERLYTVVQ
jgi:quinol monooxygenase YgiN